MERVSELLKEVIGEILMELKDPRIGFVTILNVKVSPDLRHAKVSISSFEKDQERSQLIEALNNASGFIKKEVVARGVKLRHIPEFRFVYDDSIEYSSQILSLINKATAEDKRLAEKSLADEQ